MFHRRLLVPPLSKLPQRSQQRPLVRQEPRQYRNQVQQIFPFKVLFFC